MKLGPVAVHKNLFSNFVLRIDTSKAYFTWGGEMNFCL